MFNIYIIFIPRGSVQYSYLLNMYLFRVGILVPVGTATAEDFILYVACRRSLVCITGIKVTFYFYVSIIQI